MYIIIMLYNVSYCMVMINTCIIIIIYLQHHGTVQYYQECITIMIINIG